MGLFLLRIGHIYIYIYLDRWKTKQNQRSIDKFYLEPLWPTRFVTIVFLLQGQLRKKNPQKKVTESNSKLQSNKHKTSMKQLLGLSSIWYIYIWLNSIALYLMYIYIFCNMYIYIYIYIYILQNIYIYIRYNAMLLSVFSMFPSSMWPCQKFLTQILKLRGNLEMCNLSHFDVL